MKELEYPFDSKYIMRKKKSIKRKLLLNENLIEKNIAILGGSTTSEIKDMMELFLLHYGIKPNFYESEYAQYWQDAMFEKITCEGNNPDIIFIHTSNRNITDYPTVTDSKEEIVSKLEEQYAHFEVMWEKLKEYNCPIIQNNFEYPLYRTMGNMDVSSDFGKTNFINKLNAKLVEYCENNKNFYIHDINYLAADYGLQKWSDPLTWYMYKYALAIEAIPTFSYSVCNIIKSIYGKNKKALALDLDNTLWGGIVGDDGVENLELGQETTFGQSYVEFQNYLLELRSQGVLLNVISKNEHDNAIAGLNHPQMQIKESDFISIKANWEPKSENLLEMAEELTLLPESFVFVDDNPAEREIIKQQVPGTAVPEIEKVEHYIYAIDRAGYFEVTQLSADDLKRNAMYKDNAQRVTRQKSFANYKDYLLSLDMKAKICAFEEMYMSRIAQLTNKSNQFNLTTKRYTQEEIEQVSNDDNYITLYGQLEDCFGDNGVVSLLIGEIKKKRLDMILWLMSCRVLKRDMEYAMLDELVHVSTEKALEEIYGYYYPTAKNAMVKDFYGRLGFDMISEDEEGNSVWKLNLLDQYKNLNEVIAVNEEV